MEDDEVKEVDAVEDKIVAVDDGTVGNFIFYSNSCVTPYLDESVFDSWLPQH